MVFLALKEFCVFVSSFGGWGNLTLNPFRAAEPLPILNPSNFVPINGLPVVKGLSSPHFPPSTYFDTRTLIHVVYRFNSVVFAIHAVGCHKFQFPRHWRRELALPAVTAATENNRPMIAE